MQLDYPKITAFLGLALLANELDGNRATAYRFSKASSGTSGLSFGLCQWDLSNNLKAASILKECGFKQYEIAALESGRLNDLSKLDSRLAEVKDIVDKHDRLEISQIVLWVRDCLQSANIQAADDEAFVHLCDYHNQFNLGQHGKCIQYLQKLNCPVTAQHVREFKLDHTKWGETQKGKNDINRRWDNIHKLFDAA